MPQDQLTDHAYDGIQEYDNPTPGWWTWLFIVTIVFSVVYWLVATITLGDFSPVAFYEREKIELMKSGGAPLNPDAPTLFSLANATDQSMGAGVFAANCVSCHGKDGSGVTGANLTDENYINVKTIVDIVDVVKNGRNNGAMPAWNTRLQPNEIVFVAGYVASLRGKNLPSQRPVEGKPIAPWSAN